MTPNITNVHAAPCQSPQSTKVMKMFRITIGVDRRDPPRGMYT